MDDTSRGEFRAAPAVGEGSKPHAASADAEKHGAYAPEKGEHVFPAGSSPDGEETRDRFAGDAPSPPSPRPRGAARPSPRRAKTPPTFEEDALPRPSAGDAPSREKPGPPDEETARTPSAENKKNSANPYPPSFLFPGGRLYREPPPRPPPRPPEAFEIPDDFERLAVDPEAPEEVRRLTRLRGLRRGARARAALRASAKKRARRSTEEEDPWLSSQRRRRLGDESDEDDGDDEDDEDDADDADDADDDADEDDEDNDETDDARLTSSPRSTQRGGGSFSPDASTRPRMRLAAAPKIREHRAGGVPRRQKRNEKRSPPAVGSVGVAPADRALAGIRTPVNGFRAPRANESATTAASMAMADAEAAARSPPRPTPFTVGSVVVMRVGTIDTKRSPRFSSASAYLLPIGFASRRKYASVSDPTTRVWYESAVEPGGADGNGDGDNGDDRLAEGAEHAVSVVVRECDPSVKRPATFVGKSPTDAWQKVIRAVNEAARTRARSSVSGPQFLGLSSPVVAAEIAKLPGYAEVRAELEERRRRRGH